jgi:hypothetical protein
MQTEMVQRLASAETGGCNAGDAVQGRLSSDLKKSVIHELSHSLLSDYRAAEYYRSSVGGIGAFGVGVVRSRETRW